MNEVRLKISPPWYTYINKLQALFDGDPLIDFNLDMSVLSVSLVTSNGDKATALLELLPSEANFGNVTLMINIDGPFSNRAFVSNKELFEVAFNRNPTFAYCIAPTEEGYWYADITLYSI